MARSAGPGGTTGGWEAAVAHFATLVARPAAALDPAEGALAIAAAADPDLDPARRLRDLDDLARGVADLPGLRARLFAELGLRGDTEGYYDPDNSFLHRVLDRRRGIPITLSVVTIAVGRRAGLEVDGIGMPGHFLVRVADGDRDALVDPFGGGTVLDPLDAEALFRGATGAGADVVFGSHLLPVVGPHEILARMLANLRALYRAAGPPADLEWVLRMRLALPGAAAPEVVELAEALAAQGRVVEGARELERWADAGEAAADEAAGLRASARALRARLN